MYPQLDPTAGSETDRSHSYRHATSPKPESEMGDQSKLASGGDGGVDVSKVVIVPDDDIRRPPPSTPVRILKDLLAYKSTIIIILIPIIALPLVFGVEEEYSSEAKCCYCVVVMAAYWMFEVLPLAVTALLPLVLFPLLGVLPAKQTAPEYLKDVNFLFVGSLIVAVAVEKCNLHTRVALRVLTIVGSDPKWVMLGFMSVTAFLSMWISNTATTAMMVPIAQSVVVQMLGKKEGKKTSKEEEMTLMNGEETAKKVEEVEEVEKVDLSTMTSKEQSVAKGLLICIAFAANIGGTGTLTGTPPNLVLVGILGDLYEEGATGVAYDTWIYFAVPLMLISVITCWLCLVVYFLGPRSFFKSGGGRNDPAALSMRRRFHALPPISFAEISVLVCFVILLCLWIFRQPPKNMAGIGYLFTWEERNQGKSYYSDATSAVAIAILLFMLPNELPDVFCSKTRDRSKDPKIRGSLMDWPSMQEKFPWSVVLLLGGGFALAKGVKESGLSNLVGEMLMKLGDVPVPGIQFLCVLITMGITNICSNTVTATIFVPIVASLASSLEVHPLNFCLPVALACSFAFALPVATPPNAIVFASGLLKVSDMMKAGLLISLFSVLLIVANQQTYAKLIFPLDTFPEWARINDTTTI